MSARTIPVDWYKVGDMVTLALDSRARVEAKQERQEPLTFEDAMEYSTALNVLTAAYTINSTVIAYINIGRGNTQ